MSNSNIADKQLQNQQESILSPSSVTPNTPGSSSAPRSPTDFTTHIPDPNIIISSLTNQPSNNNNNNINIISPPVNPPAIPIEPTPPLNTVNIPQPNKFLQLFGALRLNNKGAVARDHLANERTFLAWLRTSLAFASIGVAITQFFRLQSSTTTKNLIEATREISRAAATSTAFGEEGSVTNPLIINTPDFYNYVENIQIQDRRLSRLSTMLGGWFICTAVVIMILGVTRYFSTQHYLQKGVFPISRGTITFLFITTLALIVTNFAVIVKTQL